MNFPGRSIRAAAFLAAVGAYTLVGMVASTGWLLSRTPSNMMDYDPMARVVVGLSGVIEGLAS